MVSINISPRGKDKRCILHMLYYPWNPICLQIQENKAIVSLILLIFAVWHAVTYVCYNNNSRAFLSTINIYVETISPLWRTHNFGAACQNASRENEVLSRIAI